MRLPRSLGTSARWAFTTLGTPLLAALAPTAGARGQEPGRLSGVVAQEGSGVPVPEARVVLVGERRELRSGADGGFDFPDLPLGRYFVRVEADGFPALVEEVDLPEGTEVFLPIFLPSASAVIEEFLVFGRRSPRTESNGARTAADLLALQVPEIAAFANPGGRRTPTSLDLRGRGSLTRGGEPLIVLDGVRFSGGVGQAMDRLRQVAAGDVKSIRLLKGASSAFLFGAPNGVIYVQTHEGPAAP